jgi:phospholipid/cholesterol/gamma-HCH transport system ATP-binding protein
MASNAQLDIRHLRKSFEGRTVLDSADLSLVPQGITVLMGASGGGKSVLAKCVLGLITPDAGEVVIDGTDVTKLTAAKREKFLRNFGVLFQRGALFDSLPIWRNVGFGLIEGQRMRPADAKAVALKILAQLGLDAATSELSPAELSGGMQKRVALARAIAAKPEFLILDEPTEGLDPIMTAIVADLVVRAVKELGATTLAITNNIACARRIATRIAMLHEGRIVWTGGTEDLDRSGNVHVERFIAGSREQASGLRA